MKGLEQISKWGTFLAYMTIIGGAINFLSGFINLIGFIIGPVTIYAGVLLYRAAKQAKLTKEKYEEGKMETEELFAAMGKYFKLQGIIMIAGIILAILAVITVGALGITFMNFL